MNEEYQMPTDESFVKKYFISVTLFSKYFGFFLFISLPFLGFWLGLNYQFPPEKTDVINPVNTNSEEVPTKNAGVDKVAFGVLSIVEYPIQESSIYGDLPEHCFEDYYNHSVDYRLVLNMDEVWVPSLLETLSLAEGDRSPCSATVQIFSQQNDGEFIYISKRIGYASDKPGPDFNDLYKMDTTSREIEKLKVGEFIKSYELYRGGKDYEVLSDGKTVIKWTMGAVYRVDLETDSYELLYEVPENQWLMSKVEYGMGQTPEYNIYINKDILNIGVYAKSTIDGLGIYMDEHGNVRVDSEIWDFEDDINSKFIQWVQIPLTDQ